MASIKKRSGSKNYVACYTLTNGQRKQVSTGTDDKHDALQIAFKLEQAVEIAKIGQLTRRKAFQLISEIANLAGNPLFEEESIDAFLIRWLRGQSVKQSTKRHYESLLNDFREFLEERIQEPLMFLTPRDCTNFKQWMMDKGLADSTVNNRVSTMNSIFKDAMQQQVTDHNPFEAVSRIKNEKKAEKKAFTRKQFKDLIEKTTGEWKTLIIVAGLSGQRQKDCTTLQWEQVDFELGTIEFIRRKNSDSFTAPMHPFLKEHLQELSDAIGDAPEGAIMPVMNKRPNTGRESVSDLFRGDILPRIGIVQKYGGTKGAGRTVSEYSFHSLRHSYSTWLNEAGFSETDRMRIVGHADKKVSQKYTHAQIETVQENLKKLEL